MLGEKRRRRNKKTSNGPTLEAYFSDKKAKRSPVSLEKRLRSLLLSSWTQRGVHACEEFVVPFEAALCEEIKKCLVLPCDFEWWDASVLLAKVDKKQRFLVDQQLLKKEKHIVFIEVDRFEHAAYQNSAETFRILYICGYFIVKGYASFVDVYRINPDKYGNGTSFLSLPLLERAESAIEAFFSYPLSSSKKIRLFYFYFSFRPKGKIPIQVENSLQTLKSLFEMSWNNEAWTFTHFRPSLLETHQLLEKVEEKLEGWTKETRRLQEGSDFEAPGKKKHEATKVFQVRQQLILEEQKSTEMREEDARKREKQYQDTIFKLNEQLQKFQQEKDILWKLTQSDKFKISNQKYSSKKYANSRIVHDIMQTPSMNPETTTQVYEGQTEEDQILQEAVIQSFKKKLEKVKYLSGGEIYPNGNQWRFHWKSLHAFEAINLKTKSETIALKLKEKFLIICKESQKINL